MSLRSLVQVLGVGANVEETHRGVRARRERLEENDVLAAAGGTRVAREAARQCRVVHHVGVDLRQLVVLFAHAVRVHARRVDRLLVLAVAAGEEEVFVVAVLLRVEDVVAWQ